MRSFSGNTGSGKAKTTLQSVFSEYETTLRFVGTLVLAYCAGYLSSELQAALYFINFVVHAIYLLFDLSMLYTSVQVKWIGETRNIREGIVDLLFVSLQTLLSIVIAFTMFSMSLLRCGVLSSEVVPTVLSYYHFVINDLYRSGFLFANLCLRSGLQKQQYKYISRFFSKPDISQCVAISFVILSLTLQNSIIASVLSVPFLLLSGFYCLDVISHWTSDHIQSKTEVLPARIVIGLTHLASFVAWEQIFAISLSLTTLSLPPSIASFILSSAPGALLINPAAVTRNVILGRSSIAFVSEFVRGKTYSMLNPTESEHLYTSKRSADQRSTGVFGFFNNSSNPKSGFKI